MAARSDGPMTHQDRVPGPDPRVAHAASLLGRGRDEARRRMRVRLRWELLAVAGVILLTVTGLAAYVETIS